MASFKFFCTEDIFFFILKYDNWLILLGSDVPGEGEIKIIEHIRNCNHAPSDTFLVVGDDADMFLQG